MYGLFKYSYDYYEWEDFVCASEDKSKLVKYAIIKNDDDLEIIDLDENKEDHKTLSDSETSHFGIQRIEVL
jgi:hypothetical protein